MEHMVQYAQGYGFDVCSRCLAARCIKALFRALFRNLPTGPPHTRSSVLTDNLDMPFHRYDIISLNQTTVCRYTMGVLF
ncbi:hypothetical protein D3Z39_02030 [Anaerotruncus colihominis]|uniref:Uncharacterized protein n=1 Tax=Anaerotruncus colihominis TaxID=169435 RepID=A0A845RFQ1_9FIRM|nr:hypothetical protein [Anaerotruncus sp.]NBI77665.1 hypothetical protein [Anaerotruncus colihominis]